MYRFYAELGPVDADTNTLSDVGVEVTLDREQSRHASRVLRLEAGARVEVFDGRGRVAVGRFEPPAERGRSDGWAARVRVESVRVDRPSAPERIVAAATPKGPRAEVMVDQMGQVGVDRFVPLTTSRSVVSPREGKLARWRRSSVETAKQCGRSFAMRIDPPTSLEDWLARCGEADETERRWIADTVAPAEPATPAKTPTGARSARSWRGPWRETDESAVEGAGHGEAEADPRGPASPSRPVADAQRGDGESQPRQVSEERQAGSRVGRRPRTAMVLIGPEGGWTPAEREAAERAGFVPLRLGPWTLRIETAAVVAGAWLSTRFPVTEAP